MRKGVAWVGAGVLLMGLAYFSALSGSLLDRVLPSRARSSLSLVVVPTPTARPPTPAPTTTQAMFSPAPPPRPAATCTLHAQHPENTPREGPPDALPRGPGTTRKDLDRVDPARVRIMTFNIRHALGLDGKVSLERVARLVEPAQIAFLSEVDRYWLRSGLTDQPAVLQRLAGFPYAFFAAAVDMPGPSRQYGNLLLSRFPILRAAAVPLPNPEGAEARVMIEAQIDVEGEVWFVFGVHLGLDREERRLQLEAVRQRVASVGDHWVLVGDFNAPLNAPEVEALISQGPPWVDGLAGLPGTFPSWKPAARIDHVLLSPALASYQVQAGVDDADASDHLPAWAELRLKRPSEPPVRLPGGVRP